MSNRRIGVIPTATRPLVAAIAFAAAGSGTFAAADVLRVPGDFATIQGAIDAALDGDVVLVSPGEYAEAIDFRGKRIVVRGVEGPQATVINAQGTGRPAARFASGEGPETILEGFALSGGTGIPDIWGSVNGAGVYIDDSSPLLRNLIIRDNEATQGAGAYLVASEARIEESTFVGNAAFIGAGAYVLAGAPTFTSVTFEDNTARNAGGGIALQNTFARVENFILTGNRGGDFGGGAYVTGGRPVLENGLLADNTDTFAGGGIYTNNARVQLLNCRIVGNDADAGGGIYIAGLSDDAVIANTIITGNTNTIWGGAAVFNGSSPLFVNNTVTANLTGIYTGFNSFPRIINSIIWRNDSQFPGFDLYGNGIPILEYSILDGDYRFAGEGVIDADPEFVDPIGPDGVRGTEDDDLRLRPGSPAIDRGNNTAVPADLQFDLDGNPRFRDDPLTRNLGVGVGPIIDFGPFEFQAGSTDELRLEVDNIVPGRFATFVVSGGTPGARVIIAWGLEPGSTVYSGPGWCVDFGFDLVTPTLRGQLVAAGRFDRTGSFVGATLVPLEASGRSLLFQAAESGVCPEPKMSNLVDIRVP